MRITAFLASGALALALTSCGDDPESQTQDTMTEEPAADQATQEASPGDRAQEALGEAGEAAEETLNQLEEAGEAGVDVVEENAPAVREGAENVGERLERAGEALVDDPDPGPMDAEGDSSADPDEIREDEESPPTPN